MGTRSRSPRPVLGGWLWLLYACAGLGPGSAAPKRQLPPADWSTPGAGSPSMAEGGWLPAAAATETAGTGAAGSASALSDVAASTPGAVLSAESPVPSRPAGAAGASSPAEVETATSVPALTVSPVPVVDGETAAPPIEPEAGAAEGLPEGAAVWASATNPPDNGTGVTTPAAEAAAALAWFYSRPPEPHPTRFSPSGLEATGAGPGMFASVTTTSPGPAATPGHSASSTVSTGGSRSPAFGGTEPTSAALLSPAAAARTPPTEGPGSETDRPGHKGSRAPDSPGESRTGGTPALAGGMSPPAFVAWGEEVGSPGPAETKGEGLAPRTSTGITGSDRTAPASQGVIAPTGVSGSTANEEPPGSAVEPSSRTHPWRTDAERSPAATEAPAAGHTGPWSRANSSPEPGPEMATPAWPGDPLPSPRTSGLETENAGFSLAGSSAGSPQPPSAGTAAPTAPRAGMDGAALAPPAAGPAGAHLSGGFVGGYVAPSLAELEREAATAPPADTQQGAGPSPRGAELSPAAMAELPTGDPGVMARASPQPSWAQETGLPPTLSRKGGEAAGPLATAHGETPHPSPNVPSAASPSRPVPEPSPGTAVALPAGEAAALARAVAAPQVPLSEGTVAGRGAPSGGTSPSAFAAASVAPAELGNAGQATSHLPGALGSPRPAPAREAAVAKEGTFTSVFAGSGDPASLPSISDSAPPSSVGDSLLPTPAAAAGRGDAAGSTPTAHKETATSPANTMPETRPSPAPAKASPAGRAELSPGERGAVAGARTTLYSSPGAVEATGLHAPAGDTSPAAMASPWETTAGPSAAQTEQLGSPTTSFLGSPSPSPQTVSRPAGTVNAAAFPASNSAVPRASRGPLTTPGVASSSAPSVLGSSSPSLHWEKGLTPPQQGANVGSADASHKSPATTSGPSGGWAETPAPLAGLTGLRELWLYSLASHERVKYPARCLAWLRMQHEPARWNKDWPACPCSLASGALDPRFRQSRGPAGVTVLYAASPKQHGTGVRCLYNSREELVKGWQDRAWKASGQRSPSHDPALALYAWCCGQPGSPQLCARYSPKRPEISCAGSRLPKPGPSSAEAESDSEEGRD
ncbi:uncharacterized protein LOC142018547 isoform X1 [Carettochelys insculpta]|uniref:uncharacterized protein LOC142018547 isoform X1 n=1 Tax=Carettochelys insculpta TaxID=44489 RepID=UPI003EBC90AB